MAPPPAEVPAAAAVAPVAAEAFERRPEPAFEPRPAPVAEPRPEPIAREPVMASPPPAPQVDLDSALRESGLVMIQTKADRIPTPVEIEEPPAPRPRRERRPPPADLNAPLMQVETQKSPGATPES
jgi:ribonuclease E